MPWTTDDHRAAVARTRAALEARPDADLDGRVVESIALENSGTTATPRGAPLTGNRLDRALGSPRFGRWTTIAWRAVLAQRFARSLTRREAFRTGDPLEALAEAGLIDREEAERRADAFRAGTARPLGGNRAQRRAAARAKRRAR